MTDPEADTRGRCAEHLGLHDRTPECRRFITLAFARALGIKDLDDGTVRRISHVWDWDEADTRQIPALDRTENCMQPSDPEADTRGMEPLSDERVEELRAWFDRDRMMPLSMSSALFATIDAEAALRQEAERERDHVALEFLMAEDEVQRLTEERDEFKRLWGYWQEIADENRAEVQRLIRERDHWKEIAEADTCNRLRAFVRRLDWENIHTHYGLAPECEDCAPFAAAALDREGEDDARS